jgi:hypothetical protein
MTLQTGIDENNDDVPDNHITAQQNQLYSLKYSYHTCQYDY